MYINEYEVRTERIEKGIPNVRPEKKRAKGEIRTVHQKRKVAGKYNARALNAHPKKKSMNQSRWETRLKIPF